MKIGIIASIWISNPPKGFGYGAQEYLSYYIAEKLTKKGHQVTLFASGDSVTKANLVHVTDKQVIDIKFPDSKISDVFELMNISEAYKRSNDFDIIHNHLLPYGLLFADWSKTPTLHTLHHNIYRTHADIFLYEKYKNQNYVSISLAQRQIIPELNYIANVYNGVDTKYYSFKERPDGDYLLYLGRIKKYKGIHLAIAVAKKLNLKLIIAAPLPQQIQNDYSEVMDYWEKEIKPLIGNNIQFINGVAGEKKLNLLQNAKVFMFPDTREEPCPVTPLEAMACGLPVVGYARGSLIEQVTDKVTGFLINQSDKYITGDWAVKKMDIDGLSEAVEKIYSMPKEEYLIMRKNCRKHIEKIFTVDKMVDEYEKVYNQILML